MIAEIKMEPYIVCPYCGDSEGFPCGSILDRSWDAPFGPWYCEACGGAIRGRLVPGSGNRIEIEKLTERKIETADLLVLRPQTKPVYFVVKGMRFEGGFRVSDKLRQAAQVIRSLPKDVKMTVETEQEIAEHKVFFYESHSCPTNWLKPERIYYDGDNDPHGLIEFVATKDWAEFPEEAPSEPSEHSEAMAAFIEAYASKETKR
jgi:hypothetical protein